MSLAPLRLTPELFRHAASYFGDAEAQYRLARLYMTGDGVEKNVGLAVNWLATAAKKQHAAAQATLGEMLWRGQEVRQRQARGLALITLAHENAVERRAAMDRRPLSECFAASDNATRKEAEGCCPNWWRQTEAAMPPPKARAS